MGSANSRTEYGTVGGLDECKVLYFYLSTSSNRRVLGLRERYLPGCNLASIVSDYH